MNSKHRHTYILKPTTSQRKLLHHTKLYETWQKCKKMSNCWQGNGSFDFHIFMNGIYILSGYLLKYILNVVTFASVQDSAYHVLRSSRFWETDLFVIIPAVIFLDYTTGAQTFATFPSLNNQQSFPPLFAKWHLIPKFDCFSSVFYTIKGLTTCLHQEGPPLPWNGILRFKGILSNTFLHSSGCLGMLPLEACEWCHSAGWRDTRKSQDNILFPSAAEKHREKKIVSFSFFDGPSPPGAFSV